MCTVFQVNSNLLFLNINWIKYGTTDACFDISLDIVTKKKKNVNLKFKKNEMYIKYPYKHFIKFFYFI